LFRAGFLLENPIDSYADLNISELVLVH